MYADNILHNGMVEADGLRVECVCMYIYIYIYTPSAPTFSAFQSPSQLGICVIASGTTYLYLSLKRYIYTEIHIYIHAPISMLVCFCVLMYINVESHAPESLSAAKLEGKRHMKLAWTSWPVL